VTAAYPDGPPIPGTARGFEGFLCGSRRRTFLKNHIDGIAAIDLFVLPTITFQVLYCLIILRHTRSLAGRGVPVNSGGRQ
jgi:hypothetical protein